METCRGEGDRGDDHGGDGSQETFCFLREDVPLLDGLPDELLRRLASPLCRRAFAPGRIGVEG
jgi:hypothetical protein